ncbi:MAG TPA: leucyl aminopeptidase [Aquabacterium sp.]|nr:leucyl aminopeptidase [Aquabacterium sp.]
MDYRAFVAQGPALSQVNADALLLVLTGEHPTTADPVLDKLIKEATTAGDFAFKAGRTLYVHRPDGVQAARLVLSAAADGNAKSFKAAVAKGLALLKESGAAHVAVAAAEGLSLRAAHAQALVLTVADSTYVFRQTKPSAAKPGALKKVTVLCLSEAQAEVKAALLQAEAVAHGVTLARELGNLPANHCTPSHLAHEARQLAKAHKHIHVEVLDRPALEKLKMGSFLSVTNGSVQPPKFIILRYEGAAASQAPLVLVGKGITFDTGGISLKPGAGMDEMKYDMGGAASVLGTFRAIAALQPKVNLVGLIPTCENMPSGTATKPGDVVTSMSGQTIEILNTDAEGRLILCDALTYAERFKPAAVVDIATLTGACVIALGHQHSGLFSADDELAQALLSAGQEALDTAWRLPMDDEYGDSLKSNFADLANVGGREGGAITAAVFLSKFTKAYRWAHLDIAGSAWKSGAAKGGTGRPVSLLTQFILNQAAAGKAALAPREPVKEKAKAKAKTKAARAA